MDFFTTEKWNETLWKKAKGIYLGAFGDKGGKPEKIIKNMFSQGICYLHVWVEAESAVAMALTGRVQGTPILLIDYLAVRQDLQGKGIGLFCVEKLKEWALSKKYEAILLEVESEETPDNLSRIRFWKKGGFVILDDYTHHYIWVPEPYKAMWHPLKPETVQMNTGREAFGYITAFHKESFRK